MSLYSLVVCDRCRVEVRCQHAVAPRAEARAAGWVTITYVTGSRVEDLCAGCARSEADL